VKERKNKGEVWEENEGKRHFHKVLAITIISSRIGHWRRMFFVSLPLGKEKNVLNYNLCYLDYYTKIHFMPAEASINTAQSKTLIYRE